MLELQNTPETIYDFITQEELTFSTGVDILGWEWSMADHIKTSFFYKYGRLLNGNDDETPVKNITKPILSMQYWAEDIDVKELLLYIENEDMYHLSFLIKKYHDDIFLKENNIDSLLDEINQSRIDYGGGLVMDVGKARPQRVNLETIAFCNQSNMLTSPIGFKMYLSPDDLQDMADRGWGDKSKGATHTIEEAIILSRNQGGAEVEGNQKSPVKKVGKYIEVYLVIGSMPQNYLDDSKNEKYTYQTQAVCFYKDKDKLKQGITLLALKCKNPFKLIKRDEVFNRALGYGGAEELFEPQAWTTYNEIQKKEMMDAASKVVHITDDEEFVKKNHSLKGIQNNEVLFVENAKTVRQMDTYPRNIALAQKAIDEWAEQGQVAGGAPNPLMGKEPVSGTPFALQNLVVKTGKSLHDFRRGQYAKFIEEMYRDWIIPYIIKEITNGKKFLSSLSMEEMQTVSENIVILKTNKYKINYILGHGGEAPTPEMVEIYENSAKESFMKDSNKFIEILKDELKGAKVNIKINVAKKQNDLTAMTDSLAGIIKQALSTYDPNTKSFTIFDDPRMSKLFNQMLEYSNMSMIDFNSYKPKQTNQPATLPQPAMEA